MDHRRKRLKFRAWRRGFREIDLILGGFADKRLEGLSEADLVAFEQLLGAPDPDVYDWITGACPAPAAFETPVLEQLRAYRLEISKPNT